jgi:hypothetical protein
MRTPEPPTEEENWAHGRAVIPAEGGRRSGQGRENHGSNPALRASPAPGMSTHALGVDAAPPRLL